MTDLVLASRSPQRAAILTRLGVAFEARPADVEELEGGPPLEAALHNALCKAQAVLRAGSGEVVLGVDTVVELEGRIYGKPAGERQARATLTALAGRTHTVHSGIALLTADGAPPRTAAASTAVTFRELSTKLLERYLATGEWRGRAGGYAIQGLGAALVRRIEGEYENVVGLPVASLIDLWPTLLDG